MSVPSPRLAGLSEEIGPMRPISSDRSLVIACGALAGELRAVLAADGLDRVEVRYLPAHLHNRPERIVPAVEAVLSEAASRDAPPRSVFVAYADCGTGGRLDALLGRHRRVARLPGAHCYEVFAGAELHARLHDEEPGTFFLTDFLARHFEALVWGGLGLDRHPQLLPLYFGNYRRVVLLTQSNEASVVEAGRQASDRLGLAFECRDVGRQRLAGAVRVGIASRSAA